MCTTLLYRFFEVQLLKIAVVDRKFYYGTKFFDVFDHRMDSVKKDIKSLIVL